MKRIVGRFLEWTVLVLMIVLATIVVLGVVFRKVSYWGAARGWEWQWGEETLVA